SELQIETDKDKLISLLHNDIKLLNNIAKQFPLFELSERLIKILELDDDKDAIPFLEAFADVCSTFQSKYDSGLDAFIEWWNINSDKQSLQLPDDPDAIKILTIHKSKGLGFGYVIIPFCDWSFVPNPNLTMVWCSTQIKPFSKLNAYPLKCSSSLVNSFFFKDYFEEYFNTIFDNLNMLYVAFTRAKNGLFISAPNEPHSHTNISNYLYAALQQELKAADNVFQEFSNFKSDDNSWKIGDIDEEKLYLQHKTGDAAYPVFIPNKNIKIKNWFEKFDNNIPIKNGLIYHKIFENITDINSVQNALNMAFADGIISQSKAKELLSEISFKLSSGLPKIWFSKYEKLFSERSLLLPKGEFLRPDRVMKFDKSWAVVDYKFGKKMDNKHIQQVDKYAEIIESITGERVDAYVWYFFEDKIINVKEQEKIL
ncbi:MAG TPA: 3'-5' exonuclease, partial [Bacteroidales bacterium]|nr:3'-5' exonuclease [Bacteroidales bacterium]